MEDNTQADPVSMPSGETSDMPETPRIKIRTAKLQPQMAQIDEHDQVTNQAQFRLPEEILKALHQQ